MRLLLIASVLWLIAAYCSAVLQQGIAPLVFLILSALNAWAAVGTKQKDTVK